MAGERGQGVRRLPAIGMRKPVCLKWPSQACREQNEFTGTEKFLVLGKSCRPSVVRASPCLPLPEPSRGPFSAVATRTRLCQRKLRAVGPKPQKGRSRGRAGEWQPRQGTLAHVGSFCGVRIEKSPWNPSLLFLPLKAEEKKQPHLRC